MSDTLKSGFAADRLKRDLIEKIKSGTLSAGSRLISERKLAAEYSISYLTARKAVTQLMEAGYVQREPNRGVFVSRKFRTVAPAEHRVIAFVTSDLENSLMMTLLDAVEKRARQSNAMLLVCASDFDMTVEMAHLQQLKNSNVAGVVLYPICSTGNITAVLELTRHGIPVVAIDNVFEDDRIDSVTSDNFNLAYRAVSYLIDRGHRRIGHISVSHTNFNHNYVARRRMAGYRQAMADHQLPIRDEDVMFLPREFTFRPIRDIDLEFLGYHQALHMLDSDKRPSAIFAMFEEIAVGIYHAAHDLKLRIPEDLAVIAVGNAEWCERLAPPLTSMAQPFQAIGSRAVEILMMRLDGQCDRPVKEELNGSLVERASV